MQGDYPLDLDALTKGQVLSQKELEQILGVKYSLGSTKWAFALMSLQALIHDKTEMTCSIVGETIEILTDAKASDKNYQRVKHHARSIGRKTEKLLQVDRGALDQFQLNDHDSRIRMASCIAGAVTGAYREIRGWSATQDAMPKRLE